MQAAAQRRRIRILGLAFGGLIAAVLAASAIVWVNIDQIQRAGNDVAGAQTELTWADAALDAAKDQQNALAGILSTHDRRYVTPFEQGRRRFEHAFERLKAASHDDSLGQRQHVATAGTLAGVWMLAVAEPQAAAVLAGRSVPPPSRAALDTMDQAQRAIDDLRDAESQLLAQRTHLLAGVYDRTRTAIVLGSTAALAFALVILGLAARQLLNDRQRAEEAALRAQSAERAKTRFLANMSHEMRTPLNGVTGMTEALARTPLDQEQRGLLEAIRFSSSTLNQLIGNLIAVSRDGAVAPVAREVKTFHLGEAIRAMALPFRPEAEAKGLIFVVKVDAAAEVMVTGDPASLGELLACLLSNAVKFTERGEVSISVGRVDEETFGVEVADSGIGFDQPQKAHMFETFNQSDDSETRRYGGAGLGLAIARRLAQEMGGSLDAHATPGVGSVFRFEIKLAAAEVVPMAEAFETVRAAGEDESMRVLIVDDNATNRKVLELILHEVGVEWVSAQDGLQAVEAVRAQTFTAILMDIQMPVMDGLTATREIRRIEREAGRASTPVIIVSANCQPEHIEAGREAGAQRHLGKPVSAQALIEALNDVLTDTAQAA
jgi:signal transduction histidine kinase/CheY-like chemotaxis protein